MTRPIAPAPRIPDVATFHGESIDDPYSWLRDPAYPQVVDKNIIAHLESENRHYRSYFERHAALVREVYEELRARVDADEASVPMRDGCYEYQWRYRGADEYRAHYRRPIGSASWQLYLDERELAAGHDYFRLGGMDVSDASVLAYSTDTSGEERFTLRFRDLERNVELPETVPNTVDEPVWIPGSTILLYLELSAEWRPYRVRAHRLGTPGADDPVIYEETDDGFFVGVELSQDRRYVVISTGDHETSEARVIPISGILRQEPVLVAPRRRGHEYHVDHAHDRFYILTNDREVNFRLVTATEADPGEHTWNEIVAPRPDTYLRGFIPFAGFLLLEERANAGESIAIMPYGQAPHRIEFPEPYCTVSAEDNPEFDVGTVRLRYESMITPATVYDYDVARRLIVSRRVDRIASGYEPTRYRMERLIAPARDGTAVPVSIVYRDDFPRDGTGFVHLSAYGAYGEGTLPAFSRSRLSLLDRGFAYAIAHVRGGDELGYNWYLDGKLTRRWNTFHDFIDVAHLLVNDRYAGAGRICIAGASAGGEVIGVALNEAPQLWAAAIAEVPFVDVLNTMLDESLPLTPTEWPEWGNPVTDAEAFRLIRSYSPYDNVRAAPYPPIFATAGLNDPRVTYWEPAKWVARLRERSTGDSVVLLKTNMGAGHAGRSGRFEHLHEVADEICFLLVETARRV